MGNPTINPNENTLPAGIPFEEDGDRSAWGSGGTDAFTPNVGEFAKGNLSEGWSGLSSGANSFGASPTALTSRLDSFTSSSLFGSGGSGYDSNGFGSQGFQASTFINDSQGNHIYQDGHVLSRLPITSVTPDGLQVTAQQTGANINGLFGTLSSVADAADRALVNAQEWMGGIRERSRGIVNNAGNPVEAAVGASAYAINSVTSSAVDGAIETGRLITSNEQRRGFAEGVRRLWSDPVGTTKDAWTAFRAQPRDDQLSQAGASLIGLASAARAVRNVGAVADVATSSASAPKMISSNPATGNPVAVARGISGLNARQSGVLARLPESGSSTVAHKAFGQRDISALTAATGDEFAMFSVGGRRLIFRGNSESVPITPDQAAGLAAEGWRWSSHTHPGFDPSVLRSSPGDQAVLGAMGGRQSAIINSVGQRGVFTPDGDSLNGWRPW